MNRFLFLIFIIFISGCQPSVPKNVLPPSKMQYVLWDLIRADEMAQYYISFDTSFEKAAKSKEWYQTVFHVHHISKEDFKRSLQYYQDHPALLKKVLDTLQSFADRAQNDSASIKQKNSFSADSIRQKRLLPKN